MLYLYSDNLLLAGKIRNTIKKVFHSKIRGPDAVVKSLVNGLVELSQPFVLNDINPKPGGVAIVLNGHQALSWAIRLKQRGVFSCLIAGPNIVVRAIDHKRILGNSAIDKILVPSKWVEQFYLQDDPTLAGKIVVWPAGVDILPMRKFKKEYDFLVYNKVNSNPLVKFIVELLVFQGYSVIKLDYGSFYQKRYYDLLEKSRFMVYCSESESQGIAMFEAWVRDVPVYVWEKGEFTYGPIHLMKKVNSSYLHNSNGRSFSNFMDFKVKLRSFMEGDYQPRKFVQQNFSNKICAQNLLNAINV